MVVAEVNDDFILETINRKRRLLLIHSYLFQEGEQLITLKKYDEIRSALLSLQYTYPEIASKAVFPESFVSFMNTGYSSFSIEHPWVIKKAKQLIHYSNLKSHTP
ncbi:hypothetical protein D3C72_627580 [compost metagenome]